MAKKTEEIDKATENEEEANIARAVANHIRIAPRKARVVVDLIRGKEIAEATDILKFSPKRAADIILKTVNSAVANAGRLNLDQKNLYIKEAYVDQGPTLKRYRPRAMGRASRIHKKTSHITIVVEEKE